MRNRLLAGALALGLVAAGTTAAFAQVRGDFGSDHDLAAVRYQIETEIRQLSHDARDYGGHRVAAMNDLEAARNQLIAAERWDRAHGE